jgi:hypothetical protein
MNALGEDDAAHAVEEQIRAFEAGEVDPAAFDHEAHVRVVWCYLQRCPVAVTIARFTSALRALTERLGMPQKYHETISWFFIIVIAERIGRSAGDDWETFRKKNRDLTANSSLLLKRHYSAERLYSPAARQRFVLPDRAPASERDTMAFS